MMDTIEARNTTARSSSEECAGCGETFEGTAELVRAVIESHACVNTQDARSQRTG